MDLLDAPVLSYKLVCNGQYPLTNAFVTTRKPHICDICAETIGTGERVRRETRRSVDGEHIETRYVCQPCAQAIRLWDAGDAAAINARHDMAKALAS